MYEALHRLALAAVFAVGAATLVALNQLSDNSLAGQHRMVMLGLLSAALMLSPLIPSLRLPAIGAGVAAKAALLALAFGGWAGVDAAAAWPELLQALALATAGAVLLFEARLEARWDGVLPLRQEG